MQKNKFVSIAVAAIVVLIALAAWAFMRGAIYFENGIPRFSYSAITNPIPNIDNPIEYPDHFTDEAKTLYESNRAQLIAKIKADPKSYESWMDLAIYYRMVGDNDTAVEIWEYLRKLYPEVALIPHNLANHYYFDAKDYPTAEKYYRESININPGLQVNYTNMYEMYRNVYKTDTSAALDILKEGIVGVTGSERIDLKVLLGRHYRDVLSDTENARKYLTEARDDARSIGDESVATAINREINAL